MEQGESKELYCLLQTACSSSDTATQQRVYTQLTSLESKPEFYLCLASIGSSPTAEPQCKQMALLTMKSALKRNQLELYFSEVQMGYIRGCVMHPEGCGNDEGLAKAQKSLVSLLAIWDRRLDFGVLSYLLKLAQGETLEGRVWALETLSVIF
jgi:hypothetical protein